MTRGGNKQKSKANTTQSEASNNKELEQKIELVRSITSWTREDIIKVLDEVEQDPQRAITYILDGFVKPSGGDWTQVKKKVPKQDEPKETSKYRDSNKNYNKNKNAGGSNKPQSNYSKDNKLKGKPSNAAQNTTTPEQQPSETIQNSTPATNSNDTAKATSHTAPPSQSNPQETNKEANKNTTHENTSSPASSFRTTGKSFKDTVAATPQSLTNTAQTNTVSAPAVSNTTTNNTTTNNTNRNTSNTASQSPTPQTNKAWKPKETPSTSTVTTTQPTTQSVASNNNTPTNPVNTSNSTSTNTSSPTLPLNSGISLISSIVPPTPNKITAAPTTSANTPSNTTTSPSNSVENTPSTSQTPSNVVQPQSSNTATPTVQPQTTPSNTTVPATTATNSATGVPTSANPVANVGTSATASGGSNVYGGMPFYSNSPVILPAKSTFDSHLAEFNFGSLTVSEYDNNYTETNTTSKSGVTGVAYNLDNNGGITMESYRPVGVNYGSAVPVDQLDNSSSLTNTQTSSNNGTPIHGGYPNPYLPHASPFIPSNMYPHFAFDPTDPNNLSVRPQFMSMVYDGQQVGGFANPPAGYPTQREPSPTDTNKFLLQSQQRGSNANVSNTNASASSNTATNTYNKMGEQSNQQQTPQQVPYGNPYSSAIYTYPPYMTNQYAGYQTQSQYYRHPAYLPRGYPTNPGSYSTNSPYPSPPTTSSDNYSDLSSMNDYTKNTMFPVNNSYFPVTDVSGNMMNPQNIKSQSLPNQQSNSNPNAQSQSNNQQTKPVYASNTQELNMNYKTSPNMNEFNQKQFQQANAPSYYLPQNYGYVQNSRPQQQPPSNY